MRQTLPRPLLQGLRQRLPQPLLAGFDRVHALVATWPWPSIVRRLAVVTAVGMFVVLVMGTLVTNSGSARGCGGSWPLCNGQFIPQFAVSTLIEFSHRTVTAVESLL